MEEYCKKCGIIIHPGMLFKIGKTPSYKFEDGIYCENCAKIKVKKARK